MKKILTIIVVLQIFVLAATAQFRYTPPPTAVRPQIPNNYNVKIPVYYTVYMKDGTKFTGTGEWAAKTKPLLKVDYYGQKRKITPAETIKVTSGRDSSIIEVLNYNDIDWIQKVHPESDLYYRLISNENKIFLKAGEKFRELTKEDLLSVISGNSELEKLVKKGKNWLAIYIIL